MSANETRLLTAFVLVLALAGTVFHAVARWDQEPPPAEAVPEAAPPVPRESELLAFGAGAKSFEPTTPTGSWRLVWQGPLSALLTQEGRAEALPGGYFVTSAILREEGALWTLELVLSPWQEGLTGPRPGTTVPPQALAAALGARVAAPASPKPPVATVPQPSPAPPPQPVAAPLPIRGEIVLLGSFGDGAGRHWWFKEKATDRVFEVPGSDDWSMVQADGAAVVLQRAGRQYQVELAP